MTSFLPKLEDTLIDLLHYGDTGALVVSDDVRTWTFYVQGGVLIGVERRPALPPGDDADPAAAAVLAMTEAMATRNALWDFQEGTGPNDFGLYDVRQALTRALAQAREPSDLIDRLMPVLEGWPELRVDPDTLTDNTEVQSWLSTLDGLGPGSERMVHAPPHPGTCLGALWVAWKLGDLDLHGSAIDDAADSILPDDELVADADTARPTEEVDHPHFPEPIDQDEVDDVDDVDELTQTHHTEPIRPRGSPREGSSGFVATARKDPFLQGVALARGGAVEEALPLLEAAFDDDAERPGLEEWLGYTRFAVCRDQDPERAKGGLTLLRDVMYRTGPTGETPILPWILMARAQFERGDLVQARGLLASVLEKEPDDPEAMHLDSQLKHAEEEARLARVKPEGVSVARIVRMTGLVAILAALVVSIQVVERYQPPRTDYAPQFQEIVPLRELHRVPRGWVGVPMPGSEAEQSAANALAACQKLAMATHLNQRETLTLVSSRGLLLAECGERLE